MEAEVRIVMIGTCVLDCQDVVPQVPAIAPGHPILHPRPSRIQHLWKAQAKRLTTRTRLKREYLLQYNDPSR